MNFSKTIIRLIGNPLSLSGITVAFVYVIFAALTLNRWIYSWLRGDYYVSYMKIYLPMMFLAFTVYLHRSSYSKKKAHNIVIFGALTGYVAGLLASISGVMIFMDNGIDRVLNSFGSIDALLLILFGPVLYLSWLFGAMMGGMVFLLSRLISSKEKGGEP